MKTIIMNRGTRLAVLALAAGAVLSAGTVLNFDDQPTAPSGISACHCPINTPRKESFSA